MKYAVVLLLGMSLMANRANAQEYPKSIFGVSAGLNVSNLVSVDEGVKVKMDSRVGFHIAGSYELLLMKNAPLYLETGLQLSQKGATAFTGHFKASFLFAEVPLMVNYKFSLPYGISVSPSLGAYYAYAFYGSGEMSQIMEDPKVSDIGVRASVTAQWHKIALGIGYEHGIHAISDGEGDKSPLRNFFVSVGFKF